MLEDKLLVIKCRRGSRDAMCRIYEKYKDFLLTLAKGLSNEQQAAEDVVHDVFVSFARSARQFQLTGSLKSYLATCVSNRVRDKIRAKTRQTQALESANPVVLDLANLVKIAEKMKRKKAYIIAVTNSHLSPTAQLADMSLVVETEIPTYIESFTAPMSLLNALITAVALKKKKQALPALKRLETEFEEFETYIRNSLK